MNQTLEIVRILMRYVGMFLVAKGYFAPETATSIFADPALIELVAGIGMALVAEAGYIAAKVRK